MRKQDSSWGFLYNGLYSISQNYADLKHLESPIFELLDEIDSCITAGFNDPSVNTYLNAGWINDEQADEIRNFRDHVSRINDNFWNPHDFDQHEDWGLARKWATSLMRKLGMKSRGWDGSGTTIIYTDG